ncbi:MAG: hypothetical protein LQ352_004353 [Teloschistes flavicans]|nr:MAG: hypothetical protein LQ352_004353 [Teloschistes flavicans]
MYHSSTVLSFLAAISSALAAPSARYPLYPRAAASTCDTFNPVTSGPYAVQNDAWGAIPGGSQCVQLGNASGDALAWSTTFDWGGDKNAIKAYPNAEAKTSTPCKPLNQYTSMKSSWSWSLDNPSITGDVSYDAFLNPDCDGPGDAHVYEVMVWLAQLNGLNPIGSPIASSLPLASASWKLYKGQNTQTGTTVFSFVADSTMNKFDGDLMDFFGYLTKNQGVDAGLQVTSVQAGTEVSVGKATFTTSSYSISGS